MSKDIITGAASSPCGKSLTLEASVENMDAVTDFVDSVLEEAGCGMKTISRINIAVDELFGNIAHYAYGGDKGGATVTASVENGTAVVIFEDSGKEYNPLLHKDPDITLSAENRQIGGLGIFMVKKIMDDVRYEYRDGKNILTIVKKSD